MTEQDIAAEQLGIEPNPDPTTESRYQPNRKQRRTGPVGVRQSRRDIGVLTSSARQELERREQRKAERQRQEQKRREKADAAG